MSGDGRQTQVVVLSAVAVLILALCALVMIGVDRNRSALLEAVGIAVVPPPDPARAGAKLRPPDIQAAFGDPANYPDDARDRGEQGAVTALLNIAPTGVVDDCLIKASSGSASLDAATCRLARARVRFEPARGRDGAAIASDYTLRVRWQLPEE